MAVLALRAVSVARASAVMGGFGGAGGWHRPSVAPGAAASAHSVERGFGGGLRWVVSAEVVSAAPWVASEVPVASATVASRPAVPVACIRRSRPACVRRTATAASSRGTICVSTRSPVSVAVTAAERAVLVAAASVASAPSGGGGFGGGGSTGRLRWRRLRWHRRRSGVRRPAVHAVRSPGDRPARRVLPAEQPERLRPRRFSDPGHCAAAAGLRAENQPGTPDPTCPADPDPGAATAGLLQAQRHLRHGLQRDSARLRGNVAIRRSAADQVWGGTGGAGGVGVSAARVASRVSAASRASAASRTSALGWRRRLHRAAAAKLSRGLAARTPASPAASARRIRSAATTTGMASASTR